MTRRKIHLLVLLGMFMIVANGNAQIVPNRTKNTKALMNSIFNGDEKGALSWLDKDVTIDGDSPDMNPLINAIYYNLPQLAAALIEKGANVSIQNKDGDTPIMAAASMGDSMTIRLLFSKGADPFKTNYRGYNAFDYSVYSGKYEATKYFLFEYLRQKKGTPEAKLREIETAVEEKAILKSLQPFGEEVAYLALLSKNADFYFKVIERFDIPISQTPYTNISPMDISIVINAPEISKGLITRGFPLTQPNKIGKLPIAFLSASRQKELYLLFLQIMLKEKASSKAERRIITKLGKSNIKVRRLERLNLDFQYLLMEYAIVSNDVPLVQRLLKQGVNPNGQNTTGVYFLSICAQNKNTTMARLLLENGADIHAQNDNTYHTTAFMEAASANDIPMGKLLLKYGARINFGDINNDPALNYAVYYGHIDFVKFLLENKADFTMKGQGGYTALKTAKAHDYKEIIELLERYGATE